MCIHDGRVPIPLLIELEGHDQDVLEKPVSVVCLGILRVLAEQLNLGLHGLTALSPCYGIADGRQVSA